MAGNPSAQVVLVVANGGQPEVAKCAFGASFVPATLEQNGQVSDRLWFSTFRIKRTIRRFGSLETMSGFRDRPRNREIERLALEYERVSS